MEQSAHCPAQSDQHADGNSQDQPGQLVAEVVPAEIGGLVPGQAELDDAAKAQVAGQAVVEEGGGEGQGQGQDWQTDSGEVEKQEKKSSPVTTRTAAEATQKRQ